MSKATQNFSTGVPVAPVASPTIHRRGLLAGAAAALVAGAAAAVPMPADAAGADAELLADIAELAEMDRRHDALGAETDALPADHPLTQQYEAMIEADRERFHELRGDIALTSAQTMAAARAKAALAIQLMRDMYAGNPSDDWDDDQAVAYSALLDLTGRVAA